MGIRKPKEETTEEKKKAKEAKKKKPAERLKKKLIEGIRGIVRVAEVDLDGQKKIRHALLKVKGIGQSLAKAIPVAAGLNPDLLLGSLTEEQVEKLENIIKNPIKYGIPEHMVNRKKDLVTGESHHLVSSELSFAVKSNIDFMKKIHCYKGVRHELGLPVRGQRTRSSFRTGMMVGVAKGAARAAMKAAAKPEGPTKEVPKEAAKEVVPAKTAPAKLEPAKVETKTEKKEEKK